MKFKDSLNPNVKNLKNYFSESDTSPFMFGFPHIVTSGYLIDDPNWSSNQHIHDSAELIFCTAGKGITTIYQQDYKIEAGDLILHNPNTPHHESSDPENPLEFFFVGLTDFNLPGFEKNMLINENILPIQKTGIYKDQFETFFLELIRETIYCKEHYRYISEAICSCLLALVVRVLEKKDETLRLVSSHSIRIKEIIDENFSSDLNLSTLANMIYISQDYMSHLFKAEIGVSPMQYLIKKRISHAKDLLATTDMPISKIAQECGYDDPVYFSQIFKRLIGVAPRKYRESCNSK